MRCHVDFADEFVIVSPFDRTVFPVMCVGGLSHGSRLAVVESQDKTFVESSRKPANPMNGPRIDRQLLAVAHIRNRMGEQSIQVGEDLNKSRARRPLFFNKAALLVDSDVYLLQISLANDGTVDWESVHEFVGQKHA